MPHLSSSVLEHLSFFVERTWSFLALDLLGCVCVLRGTVSPQALCGQWAALVLAGLASRPGATTIAHFLYLVIEVHTRQSRWGDDFSAETFFLNFLPWAGYSARYWPKALQSGFLSAAGLMSTAPGVTRLVLSLLLSYRGIWARCLVPLHPSFLTCRRGLIPTSQDCFEEQMRKSL